jgi:putative DNA primase/helicase
MHKDFFEFEPTHKFIVLTNHKPEVRGSDYAIWRRLLLLPFEIIFGDEKAIAAGEASQLKDKTLSDKLLVERDGIFAWMVRGCAEWRKKGLAEPSKVLSATAEYREEQDRIGQFIAEQCECGPGHSDEQSVLYHQYQMWTETNGYYPIGSGKFRKQILKATRGKVKVGRITTGPRKNIASYEGIKPRMVH